MEHLHHSHGAAEHIISELVSKLPVSPHTAEFIAHFAVDFVMIMLLFFAVTAAVSYFSSFSALASVREKIKSSRGILGYIIAAAAGVLSPLCSCTIIPVFAGLLAFGVPTGYLFVFLTSASMLNLSVLISLFVWADTPFFILYIASALLISFLSGALPWLKSLNCDGLNMPVCSCSCSCGHHHEHHDGTADQHAAERGGRFAHCMKDTLHMLGEIFPWILGSVLLSSALTHLTPELIPQMSANGGAASIVAAALTGIVVHPDIFSVLPFLKMFTAISRGCGFAFSLFALSFSIPGTLLLLKVIKRRAVIKYSATLLALAAVLSAVVWFII